MISFKRIQDYGRRIGREFHAQRVVLFGSYAWGKPTADSDVDLLVILPFTGHEVDKAVEIRMKLRAGFPLDLLVKTPEKVRQRLKLGDAFLQDILKSGKVLYETNHGGMGK